MIALVYRTFWRRSKDLIRGVWHIVHPSQISHPSPPYISPSDGGEEEVLDMERVVQEMEVEEIRGREASLPASGPKLVALNGEIVFLWFSDFVALKKKSPTKRLGDESYWHQPLQKNVFGLCERN